MRTIGIQHIVEFKLYVFMYLILEDVQCLLQFINDLVIVLSIQIFISDWKIMPILFQ